MDEKIKVVVQRSLECRMAQCEVQMQLLASSPDAQYAQEHYCYWDGERIAAMNALITLATDAGVCAWQGARG